MAAAATQVLTPSDGVAVVVSLAVGFSILMLAIILVTNRYAGDGKGSARDSDNDEFSSASRSVKPGLVACSIVSAWTWAATLEQSAAVGYKYGISGPYWYAAGATIQVFLFAIIAANFKLNAPWANTFLQLFRARWGKLFHIIMICYALVTNVLVSSMLILGGSATVTHLTGLNLYVSLWVTPLGIALYVLLGGLRASFIADYLHTAVLVAIILAFAFTTYARGDKIGSFERMHELLSLAPKVEGNAGGSYLTFRSLPGLEFGIINVMGNLGALALDQSYHQRAIASRGETATRGFLLGGLAWFAVPLCIASSLGLAGRALSGQDPTMAVLTPEQVSAGLPAPAAAAALLGKSGALMMLFLLFLAVTSASSAQLVAVSSVVTFDIWQPYIRPQATSRELFIVSHAGVVGWAVVMACLGCIWNQIGVSMGFLYLSMGILVGSAVVTVFCCSAWPKANRTACLTGTLVGEVVAVVAWVSTAYALGGKVTIDSLSSNKPLLAANLLAVLLPACIIVPWSMLSPGRYDWEGTRAINAPTQTARPETPTAAAAVPATKPDVSHDKDSEAAPLEKRPASVETPSSEDEKLPVYGRDEGTHAAMAVHEYVSGQHNDLQVLRDAGLDPEMLLRSRAMAVKFALPLTFVLLILVPCMAVIPREWSVAGLGVWISIVIGWLICTAFIVVLYPVWESRQALGQIFAAIFSLRK